jgi:peptidoglycan glycosyltransferase
MGRRIRWLGVVLILCFGLVIIQLTNIQFGRAAHLRTQRAVAINLADPNNFRGTILAADGTVLAQSVANPAQGTKSGQNPHAYIRQYPYGPLFSDVVGYSSFYYGTGGVESVYNDELGQHAQPAQTLTQLLSPPPKSTDNVTLTVLPYLQQVAHDECAKIPDANQDCGIVAMIPQTGAVTAMYANPSYDPNPLASPDLTVEQQAAVADQVKDAEGYEPAVPLTTQRTNLPGSAFKVVTTAAVYNLVPTLSGFRFPVAPCTPTLPDSNKQICNDGPTAATASPCGGTIQEMLPPSCDPGYAMLGLALGAQPLYEQSTLFGFDSVPPIDLVGFEEDPVAPSNFPTPAELSQGNEPGLPGIAYSAFGQQDVTATVLQMAMVAAAVANGGPLMTPHVMAQIRNAQGAIVETFKPTVYKQSLSAAAAAQIVPLMVQVAISGTAAGVGFPKSLDVAVKTGTAQTGNGASNTNDWMIGFAPANDPKVAVAVEVPLQATSTSGAEIAGPIMEAMLEAALNPPPGQ